MLKRLSLRLALQPMKPITRTDVSDIVMSRLNTLMPAEEVVQQARSVSHGSGLEQRLQPGRGHLTKLEHIVAVVQENDGTIVLLMSYQPPCSMYLVATTHFGHWRGWGSGGGGENGQAGAV